MKSTHLSLLLPKLAFLSILVAGLQVVSRSSNPGSSGSSSALVPGIDSSISNHLVDHGSDAGEKTGGASDKKEKEEKNELPLKSERTISFPTDEGSWISVDVSPDGESIIFDLLGDLYLLPFSGGRATNLTHGMAFDAQPRFSPDGKKVLFISDRTGGENLWTVEIATGKTNQITKGKTSKFVSPEWTPDGEYLVASKADALFGAAKLWLYHVNGGSGAQLIKDSGDSGGGRRSGAKTIGAAFGDNGRYIWFAERTGDWQYNAIFPQYQIAYYDRAFGKKYTRSFRYGSAFRPTLSPDGKWLVYGTRHELHTGLRLRDLASGEEEWLAYPVQRDDQESRATRDVLPGMSFTPDSKEVVVSYGGKIWRVPIDGSASIQVPFHVEVNQEIGPNLDFRYPIDDSPEFTVRQIRDAAPSPDGGRIAFAALDRLYVMEFPLGEPRRLTKMDIVEAEPACSPDGKWIVFSTWSDEGGHLYKISATEPGEAEQLTRESAIYQQPAWSPDGERIVAIRGAARSYREATGPYAPGSQDDLVWLPSSGGDVTLIAPTDGRRKPHFTENSERIYLSKSGGELVSIRWDGSDEKSHVKVSGKTTPGGKNPMRASLVVMAPKGDQALAQVNHDLYVVTVPIVGGETPSISVADPKSASFPARRLTSVGGQFPAWNASGRAVHWSIGNAHFVYDLDAATAAEEKARIDKESKAKESEATEKTDASDDTESNGGEKSAGGESGAGEDANEKKDKPAYEPSETSVLVMARRDVPAGIVVLRGARVVTMVGDEVVENADVVVRNNRIDAVGSRDRVVIPAGARIIDVSEKTIVPGFVDTHAHLRPAWGIHKRQAWPYLANLAYGVTTTRDPQTGSTDVLSYGDMVESGKMLGPRIYSTGPGVFSSEMIRDLDHARDVLKRYSEYYDTQTIKMYMTGNRQQRQWVIMAAKEQRLKPTTEGGLDFQYNLTLMLDGYPGLEHSLPIFPLYKDAIRLVADSGIMYTPTLIVSYGGPFGENYYYTRHNPHDDAKLRRFTPHQEIDEKTRRRGEGVDPGPGGWFLEEEYVFKREAGIVKRILEAGGRAGIGSHGQLQGLGYHWELWMMQSGGMSPHQALRVATLFGAEGIGLDKDLGSLESGKLADLVVLDANPIEDIHHSNTVRYVMKNGRLYDGDTLDEIWPDERRLKDLGWSDDEPDTRAGVK